MPVKATTAPMSVRPCVSATVSAPVSKGSRWRRMVAAGIGSPPGHRREERDLAGACDRGVRAHMGAIDGGADHLRILECMGVFLAALRQPADQVADGRNA